MDLFSPQPSEASKLAHAGACLAADFADRLSNGVWREAAYRWLVEYTRTHSEFWCSQMADAAQGDARLPEGAKGQSWGAVIGRARDAGLIRYTGRHHFTKRKTSHGREEKIWQVVQPAIH